MRNRFDRQLAELNQDLIQMGHMIGQAIGMAISALNHRDRKLAEQVIDYDDEKISKKSSKIKDKLLKYSVPTTEDGTEMVDIRFYNNDFNKNFN